MPKSDAPARLTPQQAKFCVEYVIDSNGERAALAAGYLEKSAKITASRLLTKANIQTEIQKLVSAQSARALLTAEKIFEEFMRIAFADVALAFKDNGELKFLKDIPLEVRKAIASVEIDEIWDTEIDHNGKRKVQIGETKTIKFWNKNDALKTLADMLRLIVRQNTHSGPNGEALAPGAIAGVPAVQVPTINFSGATKEQIDLFLEYLKPK